MSETATCPTCGNPLPGGGRIAGCPRCLLLAGISETDPEAAVCEAPREVLGSVIGRYRLLEEIGEGGFAIVYLAEQTAPVTRRVALKVLKPGMDTREVVARFEAERQALAMMDHPNIAQIHDGGTTASGRPFFVMELVNGEPLTRYCDGQRLTTRQRIELFLDVIAAVEHAHQKGIIHRDLKPSNILVGAHDGKPVVKVIDFGIAKALGSELTERTAFTGVGRLIGTPEYMSPEQAEVNALDVDTRSDVYALGVVLYELLTGRTPLDPKRLRSAGQAELHRLVCGTEPQKPSTRLGTLGTDLTKIAARRGTDPLKLGRQLRGDLDWVVMKALEKDRARRYPSASGLRLDLQRLLLDEPVTARPPSVGYRFGKFSRRNKTALAVISLIAVILVVATAVSTWEAINATRARGEAEKSQREALRRLRQASISEARALRMSGMTGRRFKALQSLRIAADIQPGPDLRDEVVPILGVADLQPAETWPTTATLGDLAAISPDFSYYATSGPDGAITVFGKPPDTAAIAALPATGVPANWLLRFSADSNLLASGHAREHEDFIALNVWDWRNQRRLATIAGVCRSAADFSPDAACLIVGLGRELAVLDPRTGTRLRSWPCLPGLPYALRCRPDGKAVAVSALDDGSVVVVDLATGQLLASERFAQPRGIDWHRDGRRLAVACEGGIAIWNTGEPDAKVVVNTAAKAVVERVAWSHGTELLASSGWQQPVTIYDGSLGEKLVFANGDVKDLRFSPDDTRLGLTWDEGKLGQFEIADGHIARHAPGNGDFVRAVAWHPSGGVLATLSDESLRFWNREMRALGSLPVTRGRFVAFVPGTPDALLFVADTVQRRSCKLAGNPPVMRLGPPEILDLRRGWNFASATPDGHWLAVAGQDQVALFDLKNPAILRHIGQHPRLDQVAIRPQGDWLATASYDGTGVKIWSAASGKMGAEFPAYGRCRVSFSHDGSWLVAATGSAYHFHRVGDWHLAHEIPCHLGADVGWLAWSPRDTVLALEPEDFKLAIHADKGFALLALPQFEHQRPLNFSPDGSLLTTTDPQHRIHLWNLALLRAHLGALGADFDFSRLPPPDAPLVAGVEFEGPAKHD